MIASTAAGCKRLLGRPFVGRRNLFFRQQVSLSTIGRRHNRLKHPLATECARVLQRVGKRSEMTLGPERGTHILVARIPELRTNSVNTVRIDGDDAPHEV